MDDETRPIPVSPPQPVPGDAGSAETRPVPIAGEVPRPLSTGRGDQGAAPARAARSFTPPPPPNFPEEEGWKVGRAEERKPGADETRPIPIFAPPPPPLVGPALIETRPLPAQRTAVRGEAGPPPPLPARTPLSAVRGEAKASPSPKETAHPLPDKTPPARQAGTPARSTPPSGQQSRLQRALTLFVLAATLLMALGTLAVALYIYQPDLSGLSLSLEGGPGGPASGGPGGPTPGQERPPGEQLAGVVPPGTPGAGEPGPTPPCGEPMLIIGKSQFKIKTVQAQSDGSVTLPSEEPGIAYWVTRAAARYVFVLSADTQNVEAIASASPGDEALIQWGDCSLEEYVVKAVQNGPANITTLYDLEGAGFSVFVEGGPLGGLVIESGPPELPREATSVEERPSEEAGTIEDSPGVAENQVQAEISFLDTVEASDGSSITLNIEILNTGSDPITLTIDDISLTPEGRQTLPLLNVEPALPVEIQPGGSQAFSLTFPRPPAGAAVFQIWDFSLEFYY